MPSSSSRSRARRVWWLAAALLLGLALTPVLAAPGVPATCTKVLELTASAGEPAGAEEREACERRYRELREQRGALGWPWLSWCTRVARTFAEAGEC